MENLEKPHSDLKSNRKGMYLSLGCWTLLIFLLATFNYYQLANFTKTVAIAEARGYLQQDLTLRSVLAAHGGAYMKVSEETSPNPYLAHIPDRDIELPDNTPLTLINPAYMARKVNAEHAKLYGVMGKLTSLTPIRPENKADAWERKALLSLKQGSEKALVFTSIDKVPYLRFMLPMVTKQDCLQCHPDHGQQLGDIQGGITVSLPLSGLIASQHATFKKQALTLVLLWVCGLLFILFQGRSVMQRQAETFLITEELRDSRGQLRKSLAERDAITATVSDIMYMFTHDGYLYWWNKSLEDLTIQSADTIPSTYALDFFVEEDRNKVKQSMEKVFTEGAAIIEARLNTVVGIRHYQLTGVRLMYDNQPYLVGVGRDLSEHRKTEESLLQAREAAESANRAKSTFLSNMSHELRTPLNAILGYAQIFIGDPTLSEKQQRGMKTIYRSGEHLLMLINDILDLSKVEAGKMEIIPTEFHLPDFLRDVADIIRIRSSEKGLDFRCDLADNLPLAIVADELRLRQILLNLLSNAVKFTSEGFCSLAVEASESDNNMVTLNISVKDSGPGIAPEMEEKIFHPFQQSGDILKHHEGSGLGLTISRKLVLLMGGKLELKSSPGRGSCFFFSFRAQIAEPGSGPDQTGTRQLFSTDHKWKHPIPGDVLREQLLQHIRGGDISSIEALIAEIGQMESGKFKEFSGRLTQMAEDFQLGEMETFIKKTSGRCE